MVRALIALPAVAAIVLLGHLLLAGSLLDLGEASTASAPAVLALALGWGLLSRSKLPDTADSLAIALLTPLRGPICDGVLAFWPASAGGVHAAAVLSLGPLGWMLGRSVSSLVRDGVLVSVLGLVVGELAVLAGALAWLPGAWSGLLVALVVAVCVEVGRHRRRHTQGADGSQVRWEVLPLGFALGTLLAMLKRVAPAYADPDPHLGSEVMLALALPGLLVAWPAASLMQAERARRVGFAVGALALAAALWHVDDALRLYERVEQRSFLTWAVRARAWEHEALRVWWVWLLHFAGWAAAATGLVLAPLRRSAIGPLALGVGLAWLAQHWVLVEPGRGPQQLLMLAAGLAALSSLCALAPRWGLLALPLAVVLPWQLPSQRVADFDLIWRVGEPEIVGFERSLAVDTLLVSTFGPNVSQRDSRLRYASTFSERVPFVSRADLELPELDRLATRDEHPFVLAPETPAGSAPVDHGAPDVESGIDPVHDPDHRHGDEDDAPQPRYYGVRVGGVAQHEGHEPHGVEGSVGRLARVFVPAGPSFVGGLLAEVVAADLVAAGLTSELTVTSPAPLGERSTLVLLGAMGLQGFPARLQTNPLAVLRAAPPASCASVVLTPGRIGSGLDDLLLGVESLRRAARLLSPGGRCLAWIDTTGLDARSLGARLAAFGEAFGPRSAAFVEPRERDAPFVLMLGWVDDAGRPDAVDTAARLPLAGRGGRRTRLTSMQDLGALLLADGARLTALAGRHALHGRVRPVQPSLLAPTGWAAVRGLLASNEASRLSRVLSGAPDVPTLGGAVVDGLAAHGAVSDHLELIADGSIYEVVPDIDWAAFEVEVEHYVHAVAQRPSDPVLQLAVAALLEPLARTGNFQRFAEVFNQLQAETMPSWRIAALHARVLDEFLEHERAREARERARALAAETAGA